MADFSYFATPKRLLELANSVTLRCMEANSVRSVVAIRCSVRRETLLGKLTSSLTFRSISSYPYLTTRGILLAGALASKRQRFKNREYRCICLSDLVNVYHPLV